MQTQTFVWNCKQQTYIYTMSVLQNCVTGEIWILLSLETGTSRETCCLLWYLLAYMYFLISLCACLHSVPRPKKESLFVYRGQPFLIHHFIHMKIQLNKVILEHFQLCHLWLGTTVLLYKLILTIY